MYQLLLITKYLRRKLAPLFAAVAVTLCTAMVIIVISVMGGFLDQLERSIQNIAGDLTVTAFTLRGFPDYEDLAARLEAMPEVAVATPMIKSYGLVNLGQRSDAVQLIGIEPGDYARVLPYRESLAWGSDDLAAELDAAASDYDTDDPTIRDYFQSRRDVLEQLDLERAGMTLQPTDAMRRAWPLRQTDPRTGQTRDATPSEGMVPGIALFNGRSGPDRQYRVGTGAVSRVATVTTLPLTDRGGLAGVKPNDRQFMVVNEMRSGNYEVDSTWAYLPFATLQAMLDMGPREEYDESQFDPGTGEFTGEPKRIPGRATHLTMKALVPEGETLQAIRDRVQAEVDRWAESTGHPRALYVQTWREAHARILTAVGNEKGMVTFLFVIISVVAVVMVATTFYMTVLEKTRDIGTLRALGASGWGIASLFLGYGLAIGLLGAGLGFTLAWGVVTNLNEIQELIAVWTGWRMWDPSIYVFDRIPARLAADEYVPIVVGAVVSSVVGALIPATIAARLDPVQALRYE